MLTRTSALELIQTVVDSLHRTGLLKAALAVRPDTVLLGADSPLDSIGFVAFVSEMEDRLSRTSGREVFIALDEIHAMNMNNPRLDAGGFADYIATLE